MSLASLELGALKVGVVNDGNADTTSSWRYQDIAGNAFKTTEEVFIGINGRDAAKYSKDELIIMAKGFVYQFNKTTYIKQLLIEDPNLGLTKEAIVTSDVSLVSGVESDIISVLWDAEFGDIVNGSARLSFILNNPNNQNGTLDFIIYVDDILYATESATFIANEVSKKVYYFDVVVPVAGGSTIKVAGNSSRDITLVAPIYLTITKTAGA